MLDFTSYRNVDEILADLKPYILDMVVSYGHPNVRGTHPTTLEITKEDFLTLRGTCIIGINASKSVKDLNCKLKDLIRAGKEIGVLLKVGPFWDTFTGFGDQNLELANSVSIVFRKSTFISDRTVLIACIKSAQDLSRELISSLQTPNQILELYFFPVDTEK